MNDDKVTSRQAVVPQGSELSPRSGRGEGLFVPLNSKYRIPLVRPGVIARDRIVRRLVERRSTPTVLVAAAAGYGKTTTVVQWAQADDRPFAWLTLDESDNDPLRFLRYVALALNVTDPLGDRLRAQLRHRQPVLGDVLLPLVCVELARREGSVLVLDDVESLHDTGVLRCLAAVCASTGKDSQVVLIGRAVPPIGLGRVRASGHLVEVVADELAMSSAEVDGLLRASGVQRSPEQVRSLAALAEGWPAAVYLAALSCHAPDSNPSSAGRQVGRRDVAQYLNEELLSRLPERKVRFLTRSSVLESLSGPLCDAVLETTGSGRELDRLAARNLLLMPLGTDGQWFRYHHLFAELLRSELARREPEQVAGLHTRASRWYEEHQEISEAIHHARLGGDLARAGSLILSRVAKYATTGRNATIGTWLAPFDDEQLESCASLAFAKAWFEVGTGNAREIERWVVSAESHGWDGPLADGSPSVEVATRMLKAVVGADGLGQMAADAEAVRVLGPAASAWYPLACQMKAAAVVLMGRPEAAYRLLRETERVSRQLPAIHVLCLAHQALVSTEEEDWGRALDLSRHAMAEVEANGLHEYRAIVVVFAVASLCEASAGDRERATGLLEHARRVFRAGEGQPARTGGLVLLVLGETELALGRMAPASGYATESLPLLAEESEALFLHDRLARLEKELANRGHQQLRGATALSAAELRVLAMLPTHLSMREIGDALYLSRNTVKTQGIAVYRKLGVASRSAAVDRARALGLLEE